MNGLWPLLLIALLYQAAGNGPANVGRLFESGKTWPQFLASVSAQRELWMKTESAVAVPPDFVERAAKASQ